jgi:hypothetical protein
MSLFYQRRRKDAVANPYIDLVATVDDDDDDDEDDEEAEAGEFFYDPFLETARDSVGQDSSSINNKMMKRTKGTQKVQQHMRGWIVRDSTKLNSRTKKWQEYSKSDTREMIGL